MVRRLVKLKIFAAAVLVAAVSQAMEPVYATSPNPLHGVRSWDYWLQTYDMARLAGSSADMVVIDHARSNPAGGAMLPFAADEIARLKVRPDGSRRLVIAYLSIGEAEEYRHYWRSEWRERPPAWHIVENCRWPRNHLVRFWDPGWKDIIVRGEGSYLARIQAAGFDGIYLDRIDAYDDVKARYPEARAEMIAFVVELATRARAARPGFLVIAQNAEALLDNAGYRQVIDGIAKEDLLHGVGGTGVRNDAALIRWSVGQLAKLKADGGATFAVEYLRRPEAMAQASAELDAVGVVGTFPPRALDGSDPFAPDPPGTSDAESYGTPEYGQSRCDGVFPRAPQ